MTSQLNVDTIVDKAGSGGTNVKIGNTSTYVADGGSASQNTVQSLIKQWVNLDGTASGATARDSFNTASTTDNGSGDYSATFTNAMNNTDYGNAGEGGTGGAGGSHMFLCGHTKATGSTQVSNLSDGGGAADRNIHCFVTYGDLA
jgi:hypothetical protein